MKSLTYLRYLTLLPLAIACSANAPPSRVTNNTGGNANGGGISTSSGGSSNGGSTGTSGAGAGINVPTAGSNGGDPENCGITTWDRERKPADVLLVLDRSASMEDDENGETTGPSKWSQVIPALTEVIQSTNSAVAWGMKTFPEGDNAGECTAASMTDKIDVAIAPDNAAAMVAQIMMTNDKGDGTPTGAAIEAAVKYLKTVDDGNPKFIVLATDGEPSCDHTTKDTDAARAGAVTAVGAALTAGFPTFVVGVATNKASASTALNNMAVAGGRAQGGTNPLATKYFLASTKDTLVDALNTITGEVNKSCVFILDPAPPAPDFITVKVAYPDPNDNRSVVYTAINRDPSRANGWEYTEGANHGSLEVYGQACEDIKKSATSVKILYGCLGVVPK